MPVLLKTVDLTGAYRMPTAAARRAALVRALEVLLPALPPGVSMNPDFADVLESDAAMEEVGGVGLSRSSGMWAWPADVRPYHGNEAVAGMQLGIQRDPAAQTEWGEVVRLARTWTLGLSPSYAFVGRINLAGSDGAKSTPTTSDLRLGELPLLFPRWTWIGPHALNKARRSLLAALPAVHTGPFGDGWEVLAVDAFKKSPDKDFVKALAVLPSFDPKRTVGYLR